MTARITPLADAPAYSPPLHFGVTAQRLQGMEAGATEHFWVGRSVYSPGAHVEPSSTAQETVYVLLAGELQLTVFAEDGSVSSAHDLRINDSVHMPRGTVRGLSNNSEQEATLLVVIATPHD